MRDRGPERFGGSKASPDRATELAWLWRALVHELGNFMKASELSGRPLVVPLCSPLPTGWGYALPCGIEQGCEFFGPDGQGDCRVVGLAEWIVPSGAVASSMQLLASLLNENFCQCGSGIGSWPFSGL